MTKDEIFEMFDRYGAYETLNTGERVQVIHWHDLKHIAEELVKNCSIPVVVKSLPQDTDGCGNDRDKCSCKKWGGCPVD
jgi:hypothetical protein